MCYSLLTCVNAVFSNKRAPDIANGTLPLARTIHFKSIRIFTENDDKNTNPMVTHRHALGCMLITGLFSFHAACS